MKWTRVTDALPSNGVVVETKIDDEKSCRNEQRLERLDRLWFMPGGVMYVCYTPTHWRVFEAAEAAGEKP